MTAAGRYQEDGVDKAEWADTGHYTSILLFITHTIKNHKTNTACHGTQQMWPAIPSHLDI